MRPELVDGRVSVSVEVVGLGQPLAKLIIDLVRAGQVDHVDYPISSSRQDTGDPSIAQLVREIKTEQHGPYARPELRDLAIALKENPDVDGVLMDWAETSQLLDNGGVDLSNPARVSIEKITDCDAWHANVCLVDERELSLTVWAHPTRHAADCAAAATVTDQASPRSRVPARGRCSGEHGQNGLWRSLVAHLTGGQGVASSNLASPTE